MPRLSLTAKLLASFILVLFPVLCLLVYNYREANESRIEAALDSQMQTAQAIAALVDTSFDEALALLWSLANDPVVRTLDPSVLDPYLQRLTPYYPQYETIVIFDAAGNDVGTSLPYPPGAQRAQVADRPYFQQVTATSQLVVSQVLISRRTLKPTVGVVVPIRDEGGKFLGAAVVALYFQAMEERLADVTLRPDQHILLVDATGTIAFHTGMPDIPWEQRNLSDFEPVRTALEGKPVEVRQFVSPFFGDLRLGAFTPTSKYDWVVGISISADAALAPARAALRDQLIGFAAITMISVGLVFAFSYLLLRPVHQLINYALALARGQFGIRVRVKTGDELEELAGTLNYMAEEMEKRDAENARLARLRDEFLTLAAHELKTPVTGIKGYAQLLLKWEHEGISPRDLTALEAINRQADRISRLVDELLDVSRIQVGRLELDLIRFDLSELAGEVVERMRMVAEKHRLLYESPGPVFVYADRGRIEQVLDNLLDNAMKYSSGGGDIEATVRVVNGEAVVSVRDYGVGIPKQEQEHIFEPFFRAHVRRPYEYGGVGIGLYISREIIERHGGRMWFESEEGKGSTFYFSLPLADGRETRVEG